jgi:hypothetical protein
MIDLPQHAAQVALLHDLSLGRSPWAHEVRINLFTPYLLGYGLAWPLSMIMPVAAAMKVVLTAAYAAFGAVCVLIRRELRAAPQLDAYAFVSFFGFAYSFGMYTFLVAAPVGLSFIWLSIRYARRAQLTRGLWLSALGLALLFSHGLVFLFCLAVALGAVWVKAKTPRSAISRSWPFAAPFLLCAVLFAVTREREAAFSSDFAATMAMGSITDRMFYDLWGSFDFPSATWPAYCFIALAALPVMGGLKLNVRRPESLLIMGALLAVMALAPSYAWSTNWLYPRFALFLLPAYAWLFDPAERPSPAMARAVSPYVGVISIAVVGFVLLEHLSQAVRFARETRDFEVVLARAEPGRRAIALPLDQHSQTDANRWTYLHFPLWYQAEKQGFVDYNFAALHPQIVRFSGPLPPLYKGPPFAVSNFDWRRDDGARYRYFFVRHSGAFPATLFAGATCAPVQIISSGPWSLFERQPCGATPQRGGDGPPSGMQGGAQ